MASEKIQNILEEIKALSLLEANELKNAICEEFGVSADAPVMVAGGAAAPAAEATKDSWDVVLTNAGQTKMAVIKVVKEITGLGLKESKEIVDGCPKAVKEGVSEAEAEDIKGACPRRQGKPRQRSSSPSALYAPLGEDMHH